jgi:signal transduction histidine kinase
MTDLFSDYSEQLGVGEDFLQQFFPFALLLNQDLAIIDAGRSLKKLIPELTGAPFARVFRYKRPTISIEYTFESFACHNKEVIIIEAQVRGKPLLLRGQVVARASVLLFLGSPWLEDVASLDDFGLVIEDFSVHDPAVDLLYVLHAQKTTLQEVTRSRNKLKDQSVELEARNEELEQFAYVTSHDLQEPLRTISNFSSLLTERYGDKLDELGNKSLGFIEQAASRLQQLVAGLLEYSRVGKQGVKELVDCAILLDDVTKDLTAAMDSAGARLEATRLPVVSGYKNELRLLFQNLIGNAIKFHKAGECPVIKWSVSEESNFWLFSCADNGIGIAPEFHHRVFQIFQRLHHRHEYSGTGIGLAHCKKIAELHGGGIWVESDVDKGATFYFTIRK